MTHVYPCILKYKDGSSAAAFASRESDGVHVWQNVECDSPVYDDCFIADGTPTIIPYENLTNAWFLLSANYYDVSGRLFRTLKWISFR